MKSGTTTLARWLADHPGVCFSRIKEPGFFISDLYSTKGLDWYRDLFKGATDGQLLGEATQSYTRPEYTAVAAERIARTLPAVRLIYLLRHPLARIRSHYRHRRIWRDEREPFLDAVRVPDNDYLRHSMYYACLEPFIERFPREQILVVRMEDLFDPAASGWRSVIDYLGLSYTDAPTHAHNVSAEKGFNRGPMRFARKPLIRRRFAWVPRPLRRVGKRALRTRGGDFEAMLEDSRSPIPGELLVPVWNDIRRLEDWLGLRQPLWDREESARGPLDTLSSCISEE